MQPAKDAYLRFWGKIVLEDDKIRLLHHSFPFSLSTVVAMTLGARVAAVYTRLDCHCMIYFSMKWDQGCQHFPIQILRRVGDVASRGEFQLASMGTS